MPLLKAQDFVVNLSTDFELGPLSFELNAGDCLGIIGENGAGKSTFLTAVTDAKFHSGTLESNGQNLKNLSPEQKAKLLSLIPQTPMCELDFTIKEMVALGRISHSPSLWNSPEDNEAIEVALEKTHLSELANQKLSKVSGGQKQRAFIARALAQQSKILAIDEPTNHLDIKHHGHLLQLIHQIKNEGKTMLIASHNINWLIQCTNSLLILKQGKSIAHIKTESLSQEHLEQAFDCKFFERTESGVKLFFPETY